MTTFIVFENGVPIFEHREHGIVIRLVSDLAAYCPNKEYWYSMDQSEEKMLLIKEGIVSVLYMILSQSSENYLETLQQLEEYYKLIVRRSIVEK